MHKRLGKILFRCAGIVVVALISPASLVFAPAVAAAEPYSLEINELPEHCANNLPELPWQDIFSYVDASSLVDLSPTECSSNVVRTLALLEQLRRAMTFYPQYQRLLSKHITLLATHQGRLNQLIPPWLKPSSMSPLEINARVAVAKAAPGQVSSEYIWPTLRNIDVVLAAAYINSQQPQQQQQLLNALIPQLRNAVLELCGLTSLQ